MRADIELNRPAILGAIMLTSFMIAIEATIVSTAMPQIVSHLGNLKLYSWVFASFLLTQTATTVVFGKLADLYGRKHIVLIGIAVFLVGSLACGFAWSMPALIVFRALQGLGAGAMLPITATLIGDLYPAAERGKVQGWLASVWGVSSVLGPLAGALVIQHLSWAWVFWINVPLCLAAAAGFIIYLREDLEHQQRSVDVPGALLFTISITGLMLALTEIGSVHQTTLVCGLIAFAIAGIAFAVQEKRASDPMISLKVWAHRPIAVSNAVSLLAGMTTIGLTTFLPMYVQAVLGRSAVIAGLTLTVMVLGWPITATYAARNLVRFGLRPILITGCLLMPIGASLFLLLHAGSSPWLAGTASLIMGFGMGCLSTAGMVIVQNAVGWAERGAATASQMFTRSLGSTVGAALLGGVLNISLAANGSTVKSDQIRELLEKGGPAIGMDAVRATLDGALHITFWSVFVLAFLTFLASLLIPAVRIGGPEDAPR
jgi:EmrB/QacA subfamily drug resistance transporter